MSFSLTTGQVRDRSKDVTRRLGWLFVKVGDRLQAVEKAQGLRKGETVVRLAVIEVVSVRREPLHAITIDDVQREGFPDSSRESFIALFCKANGHRCTPMTEVTRIEFRYVD